MNLTTEFTGHPQHGDPSAASSPPPSLGSPGGAGGWAPRAPVVLPPPGSCRSLWGGRQRCPPAFAFPAPRTRLPLPLPLLTELFYPTQVAIDAWSPGRRQPAVYHARMRPRPR